MGATSGAHTAAEVVMTNPSLRTRVHRPAEFLPAGIEIAALVAMLLRVGRLSREDERQVPVLQLGQEAADSDQPGRSITSLVEGATQGFVG